MHTLGAICKVLFLLFHFIAEFRHEDSSDDNHSSSLGRSAPSDDLSVASDYQEENAPECECDHLYGACVLCMMLQSLLLG